MPGDSPLDTLRHVAGLGSLSFREDYRELVTSVAAHHVETAQGGL